MHEIRHQPQENAHGEVALVSVAELVLYPESQVQTEPQQPQSEHHSEYALLGKRTEVFAVGIASVCVVRADDGAVFGALKRRIHKLVRSGSPAAEWSLLEQR